MRSTLKQTHKKMLTFKENFYNVTYENRKKGLYVWHQRQLNKIMSIYIQWKEYLSVTHN